MIAQIDNVRVKIDADAMAVLRSFEQSADDATEAGGVLLGRYLADRFSFVVDAVTVPGDGDERGRYSFFRSAKLHQEAIDAAWHGSDGTCVYLGEWHTHAEADPTPSAIDLDDWRRRVREAPAGSALVFAIVGTSRVRLWFGDADRGTIDAMETPS